MSALDAVDVATKGVPHINQAQGHRLHNFVLERNVMACLELGTAHGKSACYLAAAMEDTGGHVTTIDRVGVEDRDPNLAGLLNQTGLEGRVTPIVADTSFTWELMKWIRDRPHQKVDFCFFDAGHNWDMTGYAFFLVDHILRPGGWMLFDDINWTFGTSHSLSETAAVRNMPPDQRNTPQVSLVLDLLVDSHPQYGRVERDGPWAWVQKVAV